MEIVEAGDRIAGEKLLDHDPELALIDLNLPPSGKSEERNLLSEEVLRNNQEAVRKQLEKYLDFNCGATSAETYLVRGNPADVLRLLGAPQGSAVKGTFAVYPQAIASLLIASLDRPA